MGEGNTLPPSSILLPFLGLAAPFLGYAFIARPFGRWRDFERWTLLLVIGLSVVYWTIYGLVLLYWLEILFLGLSGGI